MVLTITGGFNISAGTATTGIFNTNTYQVGDDLSMVRGNHQISFGANTAYWKMDFLTHARSGGDWNINGQATGLGLADFLVGRVARLEHGGPADMPMHMWYVGTYAQDTWRASQRVTVNAGVRWEPFLGQALENGAVYNFEHRPVPQQREEHVFINAPAGFHYPGDEGFPGGNTGLEPKWWNFSPRVGVAWDVTGDGRMAVRSSYGVAYDFPTAERHNINTQSPALGQPVARGEPAGRLRQSVRTHRRRSAPDRHQPVRCSSSRTARSARPISAIDSPRVQSWNVTFERQIGSDWGVAASYLGQLHGSSVGADASRTRASSSGSAPASLRAGRSQCAARPRT